MDAEEQVKSLAGYFPHVLFVLAQVFCGSFLVLLTGPMLLFMARGELTFTGLLSTFPQFWKFLLSQSSFANLLVWLGIVFPMGICFAEFFYRIGRRLHYINDLGLEDDKKDATPEQQVELFIWKCRLQKNPWLSRIWEWENFQSNLFFYAEGISLLFVLMLSICILAVLWQVWVQAGLCGILSHTRSVLYVGGIWLFVIVFYLAMRQGRIGKYASFRLAHKAVKKLLDTPQEAQKTEKKNIEA